MTKREINIPEKSALSEDEYRNFLIQSFNLISRHSQYLAAGEGIETLELAHLIPSIPETLIAIYLSINDAVCNKGLVSPFLVRHGHNNVFAFDPEVYSGGKDVPCGTIDAREAIHGFEPPNESWDDNWTYVMIKDPARSYQSLWQEKGYIDLIPAKFEDFTMLSDTAMSKVCFFIDPKAFEHPVNKNRQYLTAARTKGEKQVDTFVIPKGLEGEACGLVPVILEKGEKLYVANSDNSPCEHAWSNIHPDNKELAVVNENSAVPLTLVTAKPPVKGKYANKLIPPMGSADMTTDWFFRGKEIYREPILQGSIKG